MRNLSQQQYRRLARLFRRIADCTLVFPNENRVARELQKAQTVFPNCKPNYTYIRNLIAVYDYATKLHYLGDPQKSSLLDDTLLGRRTILSSYY